MSISLDYDTDVAAHGWTMTRMSYALSSACQAQSYACTVRLDKFRAMSISLDYDTDVAARGWPMTRMSCTLSAACQAQSQACTLHLDACTVQALVQLG